MSSLQTHIRLGPLLNIIWFHALLAYPFFSQAGGSLSGFGTLGVARSDDDSAYYRSNLRQAKGADNNWSTDLDTKIGVQGTLDIHPELQATLQLVSELGADNNYDPEIDWAYLSYFRKENFTVRAGRLRVPTFIASDYLNVGHAFLPVRLPIDIYGQLSTYNFDGIDVLIQKEIGDTYLLIQPMYGYTSFDFFAEPLGGKYTGEGKDLFGVRVSIERGYYTFNAGYFQTDLTVDAPSLTDLYNDLRTVSLSFPPAHSVLSDLETKDRKSTWTTLGLMFEGERFIAMTEYGIRDSESILTGGNRAWYALAGYRFGNFTPYMSYSELRKSSPSSDSRIPVSGALAPLGVAINQLLQVNIENSYTTSIGMRYDIQPNWSIKAQWEHISGGGIFFDPKSGINKPQDSNILSANINFVF